VLKGNCAVATPHLRTFCLNHIHKLSVRLSTISNIRLSNNMADSCVDEALNLSVSVMSYMSTVDYFSNSMDI